MPIYHIYIVVTKFDGKNEIQKAYCNANFEFNYCNYRPKKNNRMLIFNVMKAIIYSTPLRVRAE